MDEVNTYKINTLLKDISDADLSDELQRRGYEVFKWVDSSWADDEITITTDEQLHSVINELTKGVKQRQISPVLH